MATLRTSNLRHELSEKVNITLGSDGSVTIAGIGKIDPDTQPQEGQALVWQNGAWSPQNVAAENSEIESIDGGEPSTTF